MKIKKFLFLPILAIALFTHSLSAFAVAFSDVSEGNGNYVAINTLYEMGIIEGYEDGTYKPHQKVNRAEAIKMLVLATGLYDEEEVINYEVDDDPFVDTPATQWYAPFVAFAKDHEIVSGYDDETFKPEQTVNLVEALKIYFESYDDLIYPAVEMHNFNDCDMSDWYGKY
ncbi:hypothetical protein GF354_03935, partial [Candidatus Peregrinibacteria bacterium]|nr:hypothetical protein [Candidatus Peregrinibacteria bacterium]